MVANVTHGLPWDDILAIAARKRTERGAFQDRIFLEYVEQSGSRDGNALGELLGGCAVLVALVDDLSAALGDQQVG